VFSVSGAELINTLAFLLCVIFCAYVVSILVLYLRSEPESPGNPDRYGWHVIIPCLNEGTVIAATIQRLLHDFPTVTVWVVDDASDDDTGAVLAGLAGLNRLRVVRRVAPMARQGKGAALNAGWRAIRAELPPATDFTRVLVGVLDADSSLNPNCLGALVGPTYFGRPEVAAVQIEVRMGNRVGGERGSPPPGAFGRLLVSLQDLEFRGPIAAMQQLRRRTGSVGMGGNGQFTRLSTLNTIAEEHGTPWHGALLEDFELGLHVLLSGGVTEYCPGTWVCQEGLTRAGWLIRQRTRWAQGSMQCLKYAPAVLRSRHIRNHAALEIGYFLFAPWTQLIGSVVYVACLGVLTWYGVTAPGGVIGWWQHGGWGLVPLVVVFGIAPFAIWGPIYRSRCDPTVSRRRAVVLGLCHWIYSYLQCLSAWRALWRLIRSRSDWQKTARISPLVPDGPAPSPGQLQH
jgi:1,2-diacylglycerol 3-beta-glucosyltransferase